MAIRKRAVSASRSKSKLVYEVYFRYQDAYGVHRRYSRSGFADRKSAENHEILVKRELIENNEISKPVKLTLNEALEEFLEVASIQYQANTIYNTKKDWKHVRDTLGLMQVTRIDYKALQMYFSERSSEGLEQNKCIKKSISRVLNYCIRAGYIKDNPTKLVVVKGVDRSKEKTVLAENDAEVLLKDMQERKEYKYKVYSMAIKTALRTGLRVSEVMALHKDDFDFENDLIFVGHKLVFKGLTKDQFYRTSEMKSKKSKAIEPLPLVLKEELMVWFKENVNEKVFCDEDGYYINPNCLLNDVKKIAKKYGIYFNFHMLRHTYATTLVKNKVDVKTAQELMRHSNFNTTLSLYTHLDIEDKRNVVNEIFKK